MIEVNIAQAYSTGTRMYDEDAQLKTEMTKNQAHMDTWNALRNNRKVGEGTNWIESARKTWKNSTIDSSKHSHVKPPAKNPECEIR